MSDDLRFVSQNCFDADDCLAPDDCTCYLLMTPELDAALRAKAVGVETAEERAKP